MPSLKSDKQHSLSMRKEGHAPTEQCSLYGAHMTCCFMYIYRATTSHLLSDSQLYFSLSGIFFSGNKACYFHCREQIKHQKANGVSKFIFGVMTPTRGKCLNSFFFLFSFLTTESSEP